MAGENEFEDMPDHFEEDRELPAVQGASNTQLIVGGIFVLICLAAVYFLIFKKDAVGPERLTSPNAEIDYSSNQAGIPPVAPKPVVPKPRFPAPQSAPVTATPPKGVYDPKRAQREKERIEAEIRRLEAERKRMNERLVSKQLIIDTSNRFASISTAGSDAEGTTTLSPFGSAPSSSDNAPQDENSAYFDSVTGKDIPTSQAQQLEDLDQILPQGTIIKGILETAINSDLPGMLRAVAAENVYSFDGSQILLPKGSRLIGRYKSGIKVGQTRIFVIWERVITPSGVSIKVDSPGTDELGTAGLGGDVDTHFFKRYGSAILLTVIEGAVDYAVAEAQDGNTNTIAFGGAGDNVESLANTSLQRNLNIPPTIHVDQGTRINIFVSQDLSFVQ